MKKLSKICLTLVIAVLVLSLMEVNGAMVLSAGSTDVLASAAAGVESSPVERRRNPEAGKKKAAKRIAIGTAAGAGAGALLGGKKGAAVGAAVGAGGGAAYHMHKKHKARKRQGL